jgi:hypothetical protein
MQKHLILKKYFINIIFSSRNASFFIALWHKELQHKKSPAPMERGRGQTSLLVHGRTSANFRLE